jgi:hypothetical protein
MALYVSEFELMADGVIGVVVVDQATSVSLTDVHYQPTNGHLFASTITGLIHVWDTRHSSTAPTLTLREYDTHTHTHIHTHTRSLQAH